MTDYVYVVVRKDLELEHQQVQACHAAWEAGRYSFSSPNEKPNLVLLGVADESELVEHSHRLRNLGIENWLYHEPDDNAGHTAFACRPVSCPNERKLFRKLKLLAS